MKKLIVLFLACLTSCITFAQTDSKLSAQLNKLVQDFHGQAGIYVHNLKTGQTVEINADTLFPTASIN